MKADRATDLSLVREFGSEPLPAPELESQRADYYARHRPVSTPDKPVDLEWDGIKL